MLAFSPQLTISTAMVYFHRFFARESFDKYRYEVWFSVYKNRTKKLILPAFQLIAATCVYLACKVEESSRKASDIAQVCMLCRANRGNHSEEKTRVGCGSDGSGIFVSLKRALAFFLSASCFMQFFGLSTYY